MVIQKEAVERQSEAPKLKTPHVLWEMNVFCPWLDLFSSFYSFPVDLEPSVTFPGSLSSSRQLALAKFETFHSEQTECVFSLQLAEMSLLLFHFDFEMSFHFLSWLDLNMWLSCFTLLIIGIADVPHPAWFASICLLSKLCILTRLLKNRKISSFN